MTKETFRNVLSGFLVGSFTGALGALFLIPIPVDNKDLIVFMLGQLSGFTGATIAYHFGTSKSSVDKNGLIQSMADSNRPDPEEQP